MMCINLLLKLLLQMRLLGQEVVRSVFDDVYKSPIKALVADEAD